MEGDGLIFTLREAPPARALVGQKAGRLAEVDRLGVPVPSAFVLTTRAFTRWRRQGEVIDADLATAIRRQLDALAAPRVSVRSGAPVSMPGAMSTVLDVAVSREADEVLRAIEVVFRSWDSP